MPLAIGIIMLNKLNTTLKMKVKTRLKSCTFVLTKLTASYNVTYVTSENLLLLQKEHK